VLFRDRRQHPRSSEIASRRADDVDQLAPHVIDVEVMGVIRAQHLRGKLDNTAAGQAVSDLQDWPASVSGTDGYLSVPDSSGIRCADGMPSTWRWPKRSMPRY
jgi:hypothetical protein